MANDILYESTNADRIREWAGIRIHGVMGLVQKVKEPNRWNPSWWANLFYNMWWTPTPVGAISCIQPPKPSFCIFCLHLPSFWNLIFLKKKGILFLFSFFISSLNFSSFYLLVFPSLFYILSLFSTTCRRFKILLYPTRRHVRQLWGYG